MGPDGRIQRGVAGIIAIGAYTSALLTTAPVDGRLGGYEFPVVLGWIGAILAGGGASALVGAATLRLRADYLAIATFGLAVVVELVLRNATDLTGGRSRSASFPWPFTALADRQTIYGLCNLALVGVVLAVVFVILERLVASPWGRVLRAVREDEPAARALGKNTTRYRLQAFAIGGALMGLAGALQAHVIGFIAPDNFESALTFQIWAMLIVGGSGNNRGALLGALLVSFLWSASGVAIGAWFAPDEQARAAALRIVAIGILLSTTLVLLPAGLLGERATVSRHVSSSSPGQAPPPG